MDKLQSVGGFLSADDPLSEQACDFLINYKEEDSRVDFKRDFDPSSDKCWYDMAIDVMAFANTYGGYLVYGVEDKTYRRCGLTATVSDALSDTKVVLEKVSRGVQPRYSEIRTKVKEIDGLKYVFIHIPSSADRTHVFERNMDIPVQGGKPRTVIRQGSIYARGGASNQILTADAFEELLRRRIERFRTKLMEGLARVVHSEPTQEVIIVSPESGEGGGTSFRITDAPDALAVRGTSLAVVPKTLEDQVAAWISINKADLGDHPTLQSLMLVYSKRKGLVLNDDQKYWLSVFSLVQGLPAFYWLNGQMPSSIGAALGNAFTQAKNPERLYILNVSGFYGASIHAQYRSKLRGTSSAWIDEFRNLQSLFNISRTSSPVEDEQVAENLSLDLSKKYDISKLHRLQKLDCALYAPFK